MRKAITAIFAALSIASFVMFYKSEYDGGVYADVHGTAGNIFDLKSVIFFCLFAVFTFVAIWLRNHRSAKG
jgi:hypothetical protein